MAGKRYSRQRELIYQAVRASKAHPTAEMVYHQLKPDNPNLSLGTVYRNLTLLSEEGLLIRMPFPVERYDADVTPHSHFRCRCCGQVSDFPLTYDAAIDAQAARLESSFQVDSHDLTFTGVCPACQEARETPEAV